MPKSKVTGGFSGPPALVLLMCCLTVALMFLNLGSIAVPTAAYAAMLILHLFIFGFPSVFYLLLRGKRFSFSVGFLPKGRRIIQIGVLGTLMLILQSCVLKFGVFYFAYDYSAYTLYGSSFFVSASSAWEWVLLVLSLAVVPAIAEELTFRGIVLSEYRQAGALPAILGSALLFAFMHFDFSQFLVYFAGGALLSWIALLTGSVVVPAAVHILYNLFVLFLEKYIWLFSSNPDSDLLFWLILIALFLLCLTLFFFVCSSRTRETADTGNYPEVAFSDGGVWRRIFINPPMLITAALFIAVALIYGL